MHAEKNTSCCFSHDITAISEINVQCNIYAGVNVTHVPTIYITRRHKPFIVGAGETFPSSFFWSGNSLVSAFIVSQTLLNTVVFLHVTTQTSPVKQTVGGTTMSFPWNYCWWSLAFCKWLSFLSAAVFAACLCWHPIWSHIDTGLQDNRYRIRIRVCYTTHFHLSSSVSVYTAPQKRNDTYETLVTEAC